MINLDLTQPTNTKETPSSILQKLEEKKLAELLQVRAASIITRTNPAFGLINNKKKKNG